MAFQFSLARTTGWAAAATALLHSAAATAQTDTGSGPRGESGALIRPPAEEPAKKPVFAPPVRVHFEDAPYPEEAQKAKIQGTVVLQITIDATGAVTAAEVVEGLGYGLDEAARQAVLKFRYTPATRDGQPVPVKVMERYTFTLEPAPAPAAPEPQVGELGGTVLIADSGAPLAGAQVIVTLPTGEVRALATDASGQWRLPELAPGAYRVQIDASGFEPSQSTEEVTAGEATELAVRLMLVAEPGTIEVVVEGERPLREVTRRTLERREITSMPGTRGDALRVIESLPGVARPPGLAGLIIVRGSAPEDTETLVDGTGVPLIYHFGGLTTVIPTELLDRFDFYPGNFSTRYGRQMGGIVDIALRSPNTKCTSYGKSTGEEGCFHGLAQVDLIDGRVLFEGPLGKDTSFIVAARRSWVDTWITPVLEEAEAGVTSAPVYYDYQAVLEHRFSSDSSLSVRLFGSDDRFEIISRDAAAQDPAFGGRLSFGTSFTRAQAVYKDQLARDVKLYSMLAAGPTNLEFQLGTFRFELNAVPIQLRNEISWKAATGVLFNMGMDLLAFPYDVAVRFPPPPRPGEPDPGPFATRPVLESRDTGTAFRPGWYVEAELQPSHQLRIVPGFRVDHAQDSGHTDISPRVTARYDLVSPTSPGQSEVDAVAAGTRRLRTTIKGGVGMFHQPPQFQETDDVFGTPGLESNRAIHYSLGAEQELTRRIETSVEGFYKDFDQLVARDPDPNGTFEYNTEGVGRAYGLEVLVKYKPDDRMFGWVAYTLSRSVRRDDPDAEERFFEYDQTHALSVLGSYRLGKGWEVGARFRLYSGNLTTPVLPAPALQALYNADAGAYAPIQGEPLSERLPMFHQLDARVSKAWQFEAWRFSVYLDVQNSYNNPAKEGLLYNFNYTQKDYQEGLPILPSIGLRGEF